jgi:hypothetical protein
MAIVYRHIRDDKNEPFYVGKGKILSRAFSKFSRNKHWQNIVEKTTYHVDIVFDNLTMEEAIQKEKEFIKLYGRIEFGGILCNLTDGGDGIEGFRCSEETKLKISKSNKGKKRSEEDRRIMSIRMTGGSLSEETKAKMVKSRTGLKRSEETKIKMANSKRCMVVSDETRIKMSKSRIGKKISEDIKKKMSDAKIGKKKSAETIEKMKVAQSNRSVEHKKKISKAKKIYWQKKKQFHNK